MCGIAGFIGRDRDRVRDIVTRMNAALAHRGPDADGVDVHPFGEQWIGLAQRRLAIIDLSPLGRQPMTHRPTGCQIVFNGEIYNYPILKKELERDGERFESGSDTEIILAGIARHGPSFIRRLQGMYAFAWYDPRQPSLLISRDPAGIKPLFVAEADGGMLFASEVRAIIASGVVPRTISKAAVAGMLAYGSVPQPLSIFERCRMIPPGSWQTVKPAGHGITRNTPTVWWTPPRPEVVSDSASVIPKTRDMLRNAVRDHLISDVPVGVFLSAGLDSSIIAGLAARENPNVQTFTVGFADQPDFDEIGIAAETAKRFGVPHVPIQIPAHEAEEAAANWFAAADQPSMDGLNTFVISQAVRKYGIKVALCGLGADELFGGYKRFRDVPKLLQFTNAVGWLPKMIQSGIASTVLMMKPESVRRKMADILKGSATPGRIALATQRVLNNFQLDELGLHASDCGLSDDWIPSEAIENVPTETDDVGWAVSVVESRFYMTNVLLRDSDVNGLAHALEIRVPFLDQRLMDFAHRLPGAVRMPIGKPPKYLLREAAADVLHDDLLNRPKTGFTLPLKRWMVGPLKANCEAGLRSLKDSGIVNSAGVDAVWRMFVADPDSPVWSRALTLVALGDYLRRQGP